MGKKEGNDQKMVREKGQIGFGDCKGYIQTMPQSKVRIETLVPRRKKGRLLEILDSNKIS